MATTSAAVLPSGSFLTRGAEIQRTAVRAATGARALAPLASSTLRASPRLPTLSTPFIRSFKPSAAPTVGLPSQRRQISCAVEAPPKPSAAEQSPFESAQVWFSDVIAQRKRPYFFNREYTAKDWSYLVYMLFVHGLCLFAPATFSWENFGLFVGLYLITGMFGITLSYHRNLSHRSFTLPKWLEYTFAYCGVQAVQGDPKEWVSAHRYHHRFCDTPADPHTPYEGFWHSHMGWLLDDVATQERVGVRNNIADMENDPFYDFIEATYVWHIVASVLLLYALGGFPWVVWGFGVRAVWVYHITWFVNSASHVWGYQSWNTGDLSRNNWWVGILAFGEGWHNNHHAFQYSCRHGLEDHQVDMTWYTIKLLEAAGLATKLKYPHEKHMKRLTFPAESAPQQ
ncbi:hypothetical protein CLOM_g14256 [Closterium sp. NIES-68]|nr:hypothetical protein CLOM_g14256 [Closterium sp. NIES-68]GJP77147.1 hypothetical protein CLOP_g7578 [Closterium sp. NIES-67]